MREYKAFIFENYRFNQPTGELELNYSYDSELYFTEKYVFPPYTVDDTFKTAFDSALFSLFIMAGIGYYKAYLAPEIIIKQGGLSAEQANFFDDVYLNGLSQFLYENKLSPKRIAKFPVNKSNIVKSDELNGLSETLVAFGGGKDSITSLEIMNESGISFDLFSVGGGPALFGMSQSTGLKHWLVARQFDTSITQLNMEGAFNGHVPITGIISFASIVLALILKKNNIVFSNDSSTEHGSLSYEGIEVNHQFSKTLHFERAFQRYLRTFITPSIEYFSLLRPMSLLHITEIFIKKYFNKYKYKFSSCNSNFKLDNADSKPVWCGKCTKCAFTFLLFSPFLSKKELLDLFGGKNLFTDPDLATVYRQLLGLEGHKPLDCVGTIEENCKAVHMALATGEYNELKEFNCPESDFDFRSLSEYSMPEPIILALKSVLQQKLN